MRKPMKAILAAMVLGMLVVSGVLAAKPESVQGWSNGFPSGAHFNLNIHGKKEGYTCDSTPGGASIFVPEYGTSEIHLIQNKKSSLTELSVLDKCASFDGDAAKVQLPTGEYQVYARILGKPQKADQERSVVFYPKIVDACNDNIDAPIEGFGDYVDCNHESLIGLGVVTANGAWDLEEQTLERIAPVKGNNKAVDVSDMFSWTGYACSEAFDTDGDGQITVNDVPDMDGDLDIDEDDLQLYLEANCLYFEHEWIFNIADLVVYGWDYQNNGAKLVQVRFYPLESTEFSE